MSDQELVAACCDVIVWMCSQTSISHQTLKRIYRVVPHDALEPHAHSVHSTMNVLGDLMNAHDAVEPEDSWTDEYFREMRKRFPVT